MRKTEFPPILKNQKNSGGKNKRGKTQSCSGQKINCQTAQKGQDQRNFFRHFPGDQEK